MDDLQTKMNAILDNPDVMQQIMRVAQSLGGPHEAPEKPRAADSADENHSPDLLNFDPMVLQRIAGLVQKTGIEPKERTLLKALSPYLNQAHISKLEKAMRASKLAGIASGLFADSSLLFLSGR